MIRQYLLYIISILLVTAILLALPGKDSYRLDAGDMVEMVSNREFIISPDEIETLGEQEEVVFIRPVTPEDGYIKSSPGEIQLPLSELSVKELYSYFKDPVVYVLCADDHGLNSQAWILLTQMGFQNILILDKDSAGTFPPDEKPEFSFIPEPGENIRSRI
jgi:hypothetical protein